MSITWLTSGGKYAEVRRINSSIRACKVVLFMRQEKAARQWSDENEVASCRKRVTFEDAGWPRAVARPGLPQIRICAT
jgi:hypothetical protein